MTIPVLTFFNNTGGVDKTSLVYHLSTMLSELGVRLLAVDLDPQSNLTAAFLDEDQLAGIWHHKTQVCSVFDSVKPLLDGGDFAPVAVRIINPKLALIPGDLALSGFEDLLSASWNDIVDNRNKARPFRILSAFWRCAQESAARFQASLIVIDVGANLGAINRAALLASDHVIVPLGADLCSLQGLRNLGPTLKDWRLGWKSRRDAWAEPSFDLPEGDMAPAGYIAMRHRVRLTRPVQAYIRWLEQIPQEFRRSVLAQATAHLTLPGIEQDPYCLAMLKNDGSLVPLAQEARKPIFCLRSADGAIGAHANAVQSAYRDFSTLAKTIASRIHLTLPQNAWDAPG